MERLIKVKGVMEFQPPNKTKKHNAQSSWKRVAVILTNDELHNYYAWFIKKRFNLELNKPIRGSHVTFINDSERETPNFDEGAKLFDKKEIVFYIDPSPRTNGEHWWLRVWSPDAESIREICGTSRIPYFSFHLTLGYANEKWIDHSKYIHECLKFHEPEIAEPRLSLDDYEIIEFC